MTPIGTHIRGERCRVGARLRMAVAMCGLSIALTSSAQLPTGVNIDQFRPGWGALQHFAVDTTDVLEHLQVHTGVFTSYGRNTLTVRSPDSDSRIGSVISDDLDLLLTMGVGVFDLLDIGVVVPLNVWRAGDATIGSTVMPDVGAFSMGDVRLGTRIRVYGDPLGIVRLALRLDVAIPIGVGDFSSSPAVSFDPQLLFDLRVRAFRLSLNTGVRNLFADERSLNLAVGPELTWGAAVAGEVAFGLDLVAEVSGAVGLSGSGSDADLDRLVEAPMEWLAGARYRHHLGFSAGLGAGMGITQGYGSPDLRVVVQLGMTFDPRRDEKQAAMWSDPASDPAGESVMEPDPSAPGGFRLRHVGAPADTDRDGVPDHLDACPQAPEDADAFEDDDGCPDDDNDADGIPDVRDGQVDAKGFGACREEAEDIDGHLDEDGCNDDDNDGDGVPDLTDECAMAPEDPDGYEDADGCPDDDNDGDGFLDVNDGPREDGSPYGNCRNAPEDAAANGPDVDRDHPDGCPDQIVVRGVCRLAPMRVQFAVGNARILPASRTALIDYARQLNDSPWLSRLRIEGHSDGRGDPRSNLVLSELRAKSVLELLVASGVASERLEAVGLGETVVPPVEACKRPESGACHKERRRVEFIVVSTEQGRCSER